MRGRGYVWLGSAVMDSIEDAYLEGDYPWHGIGWYVATAGDVNSDGYDEVMFSNYAGVDPTIWICRYTGEGIYDAEYNMPDKRIEIFPNPFSKILDIRFLALVDEAKITIFDVVGREVVVYSVRKRTELIRIDTKNLSRGIYFM